MIKRKTRLRRDEFVHNGKVRRKDVAQIGDGKLPNKYWVYVNNDFYICKNGMCDWASDTKKFKVNVGIVAKYNTYEEAKSKAQYLEGELTPNLDDNRFNTITIEDRISGQIYETSLYAYPKKGILGGYEVSIGTNEDVDFTKTKMNKRGVKFK